MKTNTLGIGFALALTACGADPHERGWAGPVTLEIDTTIVEEFGEAAVGAVSNGVAEWRSVNDCIPEVTVDTLSEPVEQRLRDGRNTVTRGRLPANRADSLAVTFHRFVEGRLVEADIVINSRKRIALWDEGIGPCNYDPDPALLYVEFQALVTHELGHFFGIREESDDPDATMGGFGVCEYTLPKRTLEAADAALVAPYYDCPEN